MNTTTIASPAKLRDGTWGARVTSSVSVGDTVTITTRAGKSWDARVVRVVWSGSGVTLCATESLDRRPTAHRHGGCGCPCSDCSPRCHCDDHCVCRGGNIYDC